MAVLIYIFRRKADHFKLIANYEKFTDPISNSQALIILTYPDSSNRWQDA